MIEPLNGYTFNIQTFGCQMNKHDSERIRGLLASSGATEAPNIEESDIVVFMTCCVRESAETKLFGHVNSIRNLAPRKGGTGKRYIALGGCIGQRDGADVRKNTPGVDVVFGTNNIDELVDLLLESIQNDDLAAHTIESSNHFSTDIPTSRDSSWAAWLPITVGCDNFCTYCIVPYVRGRERSRKLEDVVSEATKYVQEGVQEITLLGQNVNSYGRDLYGEPRFAQLLDAIDATGIKRLRFATSHPKDLNDEVIKRFKTLPSLMPALHLPVQSGSDIVLERMNRHYTHAHYLELVDKLRDACPDIALSTDIIVGFPGETDEDFERTYDLVNEVGFNQVFTFIYSPRSGTPAAHFEDAVPKDVVHTRFDRLFKAVEKKAFEANQVEAGKIVDVLVEGASKKDPTVLSGRSPKNLNVHAKVDGDANALAGRIIQVKITEPKTWYVLGEVV